MKTVAITLCVLCLTSTCFAQDATAVKAMAQLSRNSEQQLSESISELNQLRERIASEKIPLAEELTAAEEHLSRLRRKHDGITRLADTGNLENVNIKAQMKARQDELTYIGNLLDEYVRTFESKIDPTELQYLGNALESTKDAATDTQLALATKFDRQIEFVNISVKRLFDAIGGMRFPGVAVNAEGTVVEGTFAMIGPVVLFHGKEGGTAGIVVPQSGSSRPLIRPLEPPLQSGIIGLVDIGEGVLPLDPSRGAALKALVQKTNLIHVFEKGGPIMWPLLGASILALGTVIERMLFLMVERLRCRPKKLQMFFRAVESNDIDGAIGIAKSTKYYLVRALGYALQHKDGSLPEALLYAQAKELKRYQRGVPMLDTIITLAPLLGLLGTVVGMMGSFSLIGGDLDAPGAITGGIAEALIATAAGLGIAITALLPFNFLNARLEGARQELEAASTQLQLVLHMKAGAPAPPEPTVEERSSDNVVRDAAA